MRQLISIYDTTTNFWKVNPQFKTLERFSELYKKDRSKNKNKSSKDMWMVSGVIDPISPYHELEENRNDKYGRYRMASRNVMEDENWMYDNLERIRPLMEMYELLSHTRESRALERWHKHLKDRDDFIDSTEYVLGLTNEKGIVVGSNVKDRDAMLVGAGRLWVEYLKIKDALEASQGEQEGKGGAVESAADTGEL